MRAILLLAGLTVAFYWKLTLSWQFTFLDTPDLANQVLPWYDFQARAWHSGKLPLWDPFEWCGQPLVGQLQPGAAFPLNWPLFWAPLRAGHIRLGLLHWHYVLMHLLAALLMYWYCRELGRSRFASVLAGAGFSFGTYIGTTLWPQMMNGALWLPLVFLFWHRAGRAATRLSAAASAAACGAAIGFALLAGHHQAPMFIVLALAGVFLYEWITRGGRRQRSRLFAVTALFAVLVGALAIVPAWEYGSRAYRWLNLPEPLRMNQRVPYTAQQNLAVSPLSLLGVVTPMVPVNANPFLGLVAVSLALLGLTACWKNGAVRVHACIALGGLAYALGPYSVLQGVLYAVVPFLDKARSPGHAVLLFQFGTLVVAAHGADALLVETPWRARLAKGLALGAALVWLAELLLLAGRSDLLGRSQTLLLSSAIAMLLAAVIWALSGDSARFRRAQAVLSRNAATLQNAQALLSRNAAALLGAQAAILLLMLVELSAGTSYLIRPRSNPQHPTNLDPFSQHRGVVEFLRAQKPPFRFHAEEIPYNLGDWDGLEDTAGYLASVSADLYDFVSLDWNRTALMLGQVYVVGKEKTRPEQVDVFSEPGGLNVFRNPGAFPRAWLVRSVRQVADHLEAARLMASADFDPRRETFLVGAKAKPPEWGPCEGDASVEWTAREIDRVAATVETPCPGMLVVSDPWFPGWQARVDGAPAALYEAYGALRGVVVTAGTHRVEMRYRPWSVYLGGLLSAAGVAGCLLLALAARREGRRSAARAGREPFR